MLPYPGETRWNRWRCGPRRMRRAGSVSRLLRYDGFTSMRARVWAFRPARRSRPAPWLPAVAGSGLAEAEPRTVKIEGPDGRPVAGARVSPRVISFVGNAVAEVPDTLASHGRSRPGRTARRRSTTWRPGTCWSPCESRPSRSAHRTSSSSNGLAATARERRSPSGSSRRAGWPAVSETERGSRSPDQAVEVWSKGGTCSPNPVGFKNGPLLTAADGSFQTPDNLLVGSPYRVVVRAPGMEPILSDWITIGEKPRVLLPMIQRPLRTISGRVVDRQGKPVAGIEVFQSGDGPERTATKTDADGRFALGGFRQGPVFLFARGEGFRFFGRLIKPGDRDITVELTRTSERPARRDADASRPDSSGGVASPGAAVARAVLGRLREQERLDKVHRSAVARDGRSRRGPCRSWRQWSLRTEDRSRVILARVARALARTDPTQAEAVAEAIEEPDIRARALLAVADALPDQERDRKLALLDRAAVQAKAAKAAADRAVPDGRSGRAVVRAGRKGKGQDALRRRTSPGERRSVDKRTPLRGRFAARLARVDLPAALAIAKEFPADRSTIPQAGSSGTSPSTWPRTIPPRPNAC